MSKKENKEHPVFGMLGLRYKSHPWHGISIGENAPEIVTSFIEMVPSDTVKYEIDKTTGYLKIDRPQKYSNIVPALYGFIPKTFSSEATAQFCNEKTGRDDITGDDDPVDICVLAEKNIPHGDILVQAVVIGGFRMIDGGEADDKIIAVMKDDSIYGHFKSIKDCPESVINRLKHYFLTYKDMPGVKRDVEITTVYDREEAYEVIKKGIEDYNNNFSTLESNLSAALKSD